MDATKLIIFAGVVSAASMAARQLTAYFGKPEVPPFPSTDTPPLPMSEGATAEYKPGNTYRDAVGVEKVQLKPPQSSAKKKEPMKLPKLPSFSNYGRTFFAAFIAAMSCIGIGFVSDLPTMGGGLKGGVTASFAIVILMCVGTAIVSLYRQDKEE